MKSVGFSLCHVGFLRSVSFSLCACDACLIVHVSRKKSKFFNIKFHIVRHSNEDNIGNEIALHHDDVYKQTNFQMKAKDLSSHCIRAFFSERCETIITFCGLDPKTQNQWVMMSIKSSHRRRCFSVEEMNRKEI